MPEHMRVHWKRQLGRPPGSLNHPHFPNSIHSLFDQLGMVSEIVMGLRDDDPMFDVSGFQPSGLIKCFDRLASEPVGFGHHGARADTLQLRKGLSYSLRSLIHVFSLPLLEWLGSEPASDMIIIQSKQIVA
jgi:hypothetical protein